MSTQRNPYTQRKKKLPAFGSTTSRNSLSPKKTHLDQPLNKFIRNPNISTDQNSLERLSQKYNDGTPDTNVAPSTGLENSELASNSYQRFIQRKQNLVSQKKLIARSELKMQKQTKSQIELKASTSRILQKQSIKHHAVDDISFSHSHSVVDPKNFDKSPLRTTKSQLLKVTKPPQNEHYFPEIQQNYLTGSIIKNEAHHVQENGGLSEYLIHMDNHIAYKKQLKNLKNIIVNRKQVQSPALETRTSVMFSSNSMTSLPDPKSSRSLAKNLEMYKQAQSKILNSTFLKENQSFKNPLDKTTFGNPYAQDKFNRKTFSKEYKTEFIGKYSPAANFYYKNLKDVSSFYKGDKYTSKQMPRETRDFEKMYMTKHQKSLENVGPTKYQSQTYLKNNSCFPSKLNTNYYGSKAARHIDVRNYSQINHQALSKGLY